MSGFAIKTRVQGLARDDSGATLVEFALVMGILLLLIFGLIDFGRLGLSYVMAQKATERAIRSAVVMAPACPDVPATNVRGTLVGVTVDVKFGAACLIDAALCADPGTKVCTAANGSATSNAIWAKVSPLLPSNATPANLRFTYSFDRNIGFLGGPYTPLVTVDLVDLQFQFVTPLGNLAALAGASNSSQIGQNFAFPSMSVSLTAESLGSS